MTETGSAKRIEPYWTERCPALSLRLWLPDAVDQAGVTLYPSKQLNCKTLAQTWFSSLILIPAEPRHFYRVYGECLRGLLPPLLTEEKVSVLKTAKVRLYPTAAQAVLFRRWLGASRFVYNRTLDYFKTLTGKRPTWTDVADKIILPALPAWAKDIPYQIKKMAVKEACDALSGVKQKYRRTGESSEMHYKSRKTPRQTCYIPKTSVTPKGIYPNLSGRMTYAESLSKVPQDSELSWQQGRWYVCVPHMTEIKVGENQARIVALDPGIRTFQTFYSPELAGFIGYHDFGRLVRLCHHLDDLLSHTAKASKQKQRRRMKQAANRLRWKIRELRDELHAKTIRFLVDHFDLILIPTFEVSEMVTKERRKLKAKSVRAMLTWAHSEFKERLKVVALQHGKRVIEVNEAYTSKTCSWSGEVRNIGSSEFIRGRDGITMSRDLNGARGIFLRALGELPLLEPLQHALVNDAHSL